MSLSWLACCLCLASSLTSSATPPRRVDVSIIIGDSLLSKRDVARSALQSLKALQGPGQLVVTLQDGTHAAEEGFVLTEDDSGSETVSVVWRSETPGGAVIDGGCSVTGWSEQRAGLWSAAAPACLHASNGSYLPVRQLFIGGIRYNRTRTPAVVTGLTPLGDGYMTSTGFATPSMLPLQWEDPTSVEMVVDFTWVQHRCRVTAVRAPAEHNAQIRANMTIAEPCWTIATRPGYGSVVYPSFFENTGNLSQSGQWWFDRPHNQLLVRSDQNLSGAVGTVPVRESLLTLKGAHDMSFHGLTFSHSTWYQPAMPSGFVERYGGVRFVDAEKHTLEPSPGAVTVSNSRRIVFDGCKFSEHGQWGLRLNNGTQHATVSNCTLADLSGGGVCVGDVNDSGETDPDRQMASILISDNVVHEVGVEYAGAPGLHSFCMRDSSFQHNSISKVGYTGISYNWPNPQGPSFTNDSKIGYSANNQVVRNEVSEFMSYMNDGGGIHTIGRSYNTTISENHFHDIAAGMPDSHSKFGQSVLYVDNWSCGLTLSRNVVADCVGTKQGPWFFQGARNGMAHDNIIQTLYLANAGLLSGHSLPCNCSNVVNASSVGDLPTSAKDIIVAAGPRWMLSSKF